MYVNEFSCRSGRTEDHFPFPSLTIERIGKETRWVSDEYLGLSVAFVRSVHLLVPSWWRPEGLVIFFLNLFLVFMPMFTHILTRFMSHKDTDAFRVTRLSYAVQAFLACKQISVLCSFDRLFVQRPNRGWRPRLFGESKQLYLKHLLVTHIFMPFPMCCFLKCWLLSENEWFSWDF